MSDDERFLSRWSRRKREAARPEHQYATDKPLDVEALPDADVEEGAREAMVRTASRETAGNPETLAFDPAGLPPIETIGPDTDIMGFLEANVPGELKRAALRHTWASDPAIRDFVGLQENDWDFTKTDSIPGFGELSAEFDVAGMVRRVFGDSTELPEEEEERTSEAAAAELGSEPALQPQSGPLEMAAQSQGSDRTGPDQAEECASTAVTAAQPEPLMLHRNIDAASQTNDDPTAVYSKLYRHHGSALPQDPPTKNRDP